MRRLETTTDLLDALQEKHGWTDNQISVRLKIPSATVSGWRTGRMYPTEVHALKIAAALEIPALMVLAIAAADRSPDPEAASTWSKIARQIARGGVAALAAFAVTTVSYSPPASAADDVCILRKVTHRRRSPQPQAA